MQKKIDVEKRLSYQKETAERNFYSAMESKDRESIGSAMLLLNIVDWEIMMRSFSDSSPYIPLDKLKK